MCKKAALQIMFMLYVNLAMYRSQERNLFFNFVLIIAALISFASRGISLSSFTHLLFLGNADCQGFQMYTSNYVICSFLGSADFLGYQMYTSYYISSAVQPLFPSGYSADMDVDTSQDPSWKG